MAKATKEIVWGGAAVAGGALQNVFFSNVMLLQWYVLVEAVLQICGTEAMKCLAADLRHLEWNPGINLP